VEFLSQEGVDLQQLAEEKNAIYLVIPDENTTYHFIVSLFLEQLYEVLLEKAQKEPSQKLPIRMNFLIDEFANIPKIQNMDAMITAARSRNIRFHLIVQGMKQLQQKYEEGADTISGNCNNWIYLYSKEFELLQEISRLCGEVIYDNNVRIPLFSEFDLQHLNKEEGEALVLAGRNYPCLSNLADIDEYPYPKVNAQNMLTVQRWKKAAGLGSGKKNQQCYYCEPEQETANELEELMSLLGKENKGKEYNWLVAVGPDNMILAEGIYEKHLIDCGAAIGALICEQLSDGKFETELLEWYQADIEKRRRYRFILKHSPHRVYVTLDDLGINKFTKVAERKQAENCFSNTRASNVELTFTDDVNRDPNREVTLGPVKAYCGKIGTTHLLNVAFARANDELQETEFQYVPWNVLVKGRNEIGEDYFYYQFYKKGASGKLVILEIRDYRDVNKYSFINL